MTSPLPLDRIRQEHQRNVAEAQRRAGIISEMKALFNNFISQHHFRDNPSYEYWLQNTAILDPLEKDMQINWYFRYPLWAKTVNPAMGRAENDDTVLNYFSGRFTKEQFDEQLKKMGKKDKNGNQVILPGAKIEIERSEEEFVARMFKTDWDLMSESDHYRMITIYKKNNKEFLSDRSKLYHGLLQNNVGSVYGLINNVNSYLKTVSAPVEPGTESKATEDYYYETLVPRAATVVWWYDGGAENLNIGARAVWLSRVRTPNPVQDASIFARNVQDKVSSTLSDNKYFVAGFLLLLAAIPAVISHL